MKEDVKMEKIHLIALIGESATGKDTIAKEIAGLSGGEWSRLIPYTTRPRRENEKKDDNYHFINREDFLEHLDDFIETSSFSVKKDVWWYGTMIPAPGNYVGVFNPLGIYKLECQKNINLNIFKLIVPPRVRLLRSIAREQNGDYYEVCRRFCADEDAFRNLNLLFSYTCIDNGEEYSPKEVAAEILNIVS